MNTLIVGCGNMGGAMLAGWLAGGMAADSLTVVDPLVAEVPEGVTLHRSLDALSAQAQTFATVLLAFKPQQFAEAAPAIAPLANGLVMSVLAGIDLAALARHFPAASARVRVMPNLAAALGKSPIALAGDLSADRRAEVTALFAPLGTPEWIGEDAFDLVTALAGSGPAFVYRFIDALAAGAADLGLERAQADRLALAMVEGAAALAAASPHPPAELARRVASPGGVTQRGIDVLDADAALVRLITATLRAARDRSAAMGREHGGDPGPGR